MKPCLLFLTCANEKEANNIGQTLLDNKLVACVKTSKVNSSFLWQGKIEKADEVLLIMDSVEELFEMVEKLIKTIHSYDLFVLASVPVTKSSIGIESWMKSELQVK